MRKTIQLLAGGIVFSGQERPAGAKAIRDDLVKKFATAEGLSGRLPYGRLTQLLRIVGWKRIELNRIFHFEEITEQNIESILRRFAVIKIHAKFYEKQYLDKHLADHEQYGIFAREKDAKAFLTSSQGVVAGLRIHQVFAEENSLQQLDDKIIKFTRCGGDNGVTEKSIREACRLPPLTGDGEVGPERKLISPSQEDAGDALVKELEVAALHYAHELVRSDRTAKCGYLTEAVFKVLNLPAGSKRRKPDLWELLCVHGHFLQCQGGKYLPKIAHEKCQDELGFFQLPAAPQDEFTEHYDVASFQNTFFNSAVREMNAQLCLRVLDGNAPRRPDKGKGKGKGRGRKRKHEEAHHRATNQRGKEEQQKRHAEIQGMEDNIEFFRSLFAQPPAAGPAPSGSVSHAAPLTEVAHAIALSPRRRISQKVGPPGAPCSRICEQTVAYSRAYPFRTRRNARGCAAQNIQQVVQEALLPQTWDVDISNSMFSFCGQIAKMSLGRHAADWAPELAHVDELAGNRERICKEQLQLPTIEGKDILLTVWCGGALPLELRSNTYLLKHSRVSRWWRALACSLRPDVHGHCQENVDCWAEASTASHVYFAAEDYVLEKIVEFLLQAVSGHVSLHYDGVRLSKSDCERLVDMQDTAIINESHDSGDSKQTAFLSLCEQHIHGQTGFAVKLKIKEHRCFLDLISTADAVPAPVLHEVLYNAGNCTLLALAYIQGNHRDIVTKLASASDTPAEIDSVRLGCRTYQECALLAGAHLVPCWLLTLTPDTSWLVHCEKHGQPHCIGLKVGSDASCTVWSGRHQHNQSILELKEMIAMAIDRRIMFFYQVLSAAMEQPRVEDADMRELMQLRAGAGDSDDEDTPLENILWIEYPDVRDDGDESVVHVNRELRRILQAEVEEALAAVEASRGKHTRGIARCPFCPCKAFNPGMKQRSQLTRHLRNKHLYDPKRHSDDGSCRHNVASGTKQLKLICALFDDDALRSVLRTDYLRHSADFLRALCPVWQRVRKHDTDIDRFLCLCLDRTGPRLQWRSRDEPLKGVRRVGYTYYTREFADQLVMYALTEHGSFEGIRHRMVQAAIVNSNRLWHMLPRHAEGWCGLLEDVFHSEHMDEFWHRLVDECIDHDEFSHLCIDGTLRCAMRMAGQGNYRESTQQRALYCFDDRTAKRCVLTVRGRTGPVAGLWLIRWEDASAIEDAFRARFPQRAKAQVSAIAVDDPSGRLFKALKRVLNNLLCIYLGPVHIVIFYSQSHNRKFTKGQSFLRLIMNRFNKVDPVLPSGYWGVVFTGEQTPYHTHAHSVHAYAHCQRYAPLASGRGCTA